MPVVHPELSQQPLVLAALELGAVELDVLGGDVHAVGHSRAEGQQRFVPVGLQSIAASSLWRANQLVIGVAYYLHYPAVSTC